MFVDLETFLTAEIYRYVFVFVRITTAFLLFPAIGEQVFPRRVRLVTALAVSFAITPIIPGLPEAPPDSPIVLIAEFLEELIAGAFIGGTARLFHSAMAVAGQMIGRAIVLANVFTLPFNDNGAGSIVAAFLSLTGIALIFAMNIHHLMISAFVQSYDLIPPAEPLDTRVMALIFSRLTDDMFRIGSELAAPFLVLNFVFYLGIGLINRMMQQMPVFFVALPGALMGGMLILFSVGAILLPGFAAPMADWLTTLRL